MSETIIEEKKDEVVEEKPKKPIISPEYCSWVNEEDTGYIFEVILPGVERDTIKLKMNTENLFVAGETDSVRYVGAFGLCCPVDADHATSTYKNGLLRIKVPFQEITLNTVDVKIE